MAGFDHSVLTDVGWDALADAMSGKTLTFVHFEAGDGTVTGDAQMQSMTQLVNKKMNFNITSFSDDGKGQVTLIGTLTSKNVPPGGGFFFRELGVKATINNGPELLYCVANSGADANYIPDQNDTAIVIQTVEIIVKIDRTVTPVINVVPGGDVTAQNIGPGTVGPGWFRDKVASILNFKRLVSGFGINALETSDTIIVSLNQIIQDLDLYVPYDAAKPTTSFPTIQAAHDSLKNSSFAADKVCRIHVAAGVLANQTVTTLNHAQLDHVQILGVTPTETHNINFASAASGTVTYSIDNIGTLAVGDYVTVMHGSTGTSGDYLSYDGLNCVQAISGLNVTLKLPPMRISGRPGAATLTKIPTVVKMAANNHGLVVAKGTLGRLSNIVFVGDNNVNNQTQGITVLDQCGIYIVGDQNTDGSGTWKDCFVGVTGFYFGIRDGFGNHFGIAGAMVVSSRLLVSFNNWDGCSFYAGIFADMWKLITVGNARDGINCDAFVASEYGIAAANGRVGFLAAGGNMYIPWALAASNVNGGVQTYFLGNATNDYGTMWGNGGSADYVASNMGFISVKNAWSGSTFSPPINTEGNNNALIVANLVIKTLGADGYPIVGDPNVAAVRSSVLDQIPLLPV